MAKTAAGVSWIAGTVAVVLIGTATGPTYAQRAPSELATPPPASGRSLSAPASITAADVLSRLVLVHDNLEQIRLFMGRPAAPPPLFRAQGVSTAEVYFASLNLKRRGLRLAFEQLRVEQAWNETIPERPAPVDAFRVIDGLLVTTLQLKAALQIERPVAERALPEATTMTDVFNQMLTTGPLLNSLLDKRTAPEDTFLLLTVAVNQTMLIHRKFTRVVMPDEPAFEPNKTPADVLRQIEPIFERVRVLGDVAGVPMLTLERSGARRDVIPDDLSELGVLLIAELDRVIVALGIERIQRSAGAVGRKFPSHSYQRARMLRTIVDQSVAGAQRQL